MGYRGAPSGGRRWGIGVHHQGEVMGYRGTPSGGRRWGIGMHHHGVGDGV